VPVAPSGAVPDAAMVVTADHEIVGGDMHVPVDVYVPVDMNVPVDVDVPVDMDVVMGVDMSRECRRGDQECRCKCGGHRKFLHDRHAGQRNTLYDLATALRGKVLFVCH